MPLHPRHGYAAGIHHSLPADDILRPESSSFTVNDDDRVRDAIRPISTRFRVGGLA